MTKLRLSLDALQVESFETRDNDTPQRGTVPGYANTRPDVCRTDPMYCLSFNYSECNTCQVTCDASCNGTCGGLNCQPTYAGATCPPECFD